MRVQPISEQSPIQTSEIAPELINPETILDTKKINSSVDHKSMEELVYLVHHLAIKTHTNCLDIQRNLMLDEQEWNKLHETKKLAHIESVQNNVKYLEGAKTVDKVISTAGFIFAGIATVAAGPTPLGIAALVGSGLLTLDALFNHAGKK